MKRKKFKKISKNIYKIDNVFPEKVIEKIFFMYKNLDLKSWKLISQKKPHLYSSLFKNSSEFLPNKNEVYFAKFCRSDKLRNNPYIKFSIKKFIFPLLKKYLKFNVKQYDIRCHKYVKNNLARLHFDDYAGAYAITLNLNKTWKWDWGGILSVAGGNSGEELYSILPNWNSMNIVYSGKNSSPHFVTPVQPFAKSSRYSMTIFVK